MPSLDIVSEVDSAEILNATNNAARELTTRFDFRGVDATITVANDVVTLKAEADFQLKQMMDVLLRSLVAVPATILMHGPIARLYRVFVD